MLYIVILCHGYLSVLCGSSQWLRMVKHLVIRQSLALLSCLLVPVNLQMVNTSNASVVLVLLGKYSAYKCRMNRSLMCYVQGSSVQTVIVEKIVFMCKISLNRVYCRIRLVLIYTQNLL